MRRALAAGGAAILIAGPTALAFFSGGYFDRPRLVAAVVAWALVILAALTARPLPVPPAGCRWPGCCSCASGPPSRSRGRP